MQWEHTFDDKVVITVLKVEKSESNFKAPVDQVLFKLKVFDFFFRES